MSPSQYLSPDELDCLGFAELGENVLIHRMSNIVHSGYLSIGSNVRIDGFTVLSVSGGLRIGSYVHIGSFCYLAGAASIELNDFVGLSQGVKVYSSTDDYSGTSLTNPTVPSKYKNVRSEAVCLNRHVIIGAGSIVLPGVEIGEGASVGALSLVSRSLEGWGIFAGVPARHVGVRSQLLLQKERALFNEVDGSV